MFKYRGKAIKKIGRWLLVFAALSTTAFWFAQEKIPQGVSGWQADALAHKMIHALDYEAWKEAQYLQWTFMGRNHYKWDRMGNWVEVRWQSKRVLIHTPTQEGFAWVGDHLQEGYAKQKLLAKAWSNFCNDGFWLFAPFKVFDEGVERKWVKWEGSDALLVTYTNGGVTPGDSYLWILGEEGLPKSWKMWVSIIPIKGLEADWEGWTKTELGTFSLSKKVAFVPLSCTNFKVSLNLEDICPGLDCFKFP
jgi:hypothetical protein